MGFFLPLHILAVVKPRYFELAIILIPHSAHEVQIVFRDPFFPEVDFLLHLQGDNIRLGYGHDWFRLLYLLLETQILLTKFRSIFVAAVFLHFLEITR